MIFSDKIILGTANFGKSYGLFKNKVDRNEIRGILNFAKKKEIKYLDTAKEYGKLDSSFNKDFKKFKIFKKLDLNFNLLKINSRKNLTENLNKKIFNDYPCFALTLRKPNILLKTNGKKIFDILNKYRKSGKIKKIGISIYKTEKLKKIINNFKIDYIQIPLNIVNSKVFYSTKKIIKNKKIEIHARSIFLQGLLLKESYQLPPELKKLKTQWKKFEKDLIRLKLTHYEACLNFVINFKVDKIILGVNDKNQLKEFLNFNKKKLKVPFLYVKYSKLINPIYWSKFKKK